MRTPINDFFGPQFEAGGLVYFGKFSQLLYNNQLYAQLGLWMVGICTVFIIAFYLLGFGRLATRSAWLTALVMVVAICTFIGFTTITNFFHKIAYPIPAGALSSFLLIYSCLSAFYFFLMSFVRKLPGTSLSFRKIPF